MQNIIKKASPVLQQALNLVYRYASYRFHIVAGQGDIRQIPDGSLGAVQLAEYSAKELMLNTGNVQRWVEKAKKNPAWPIEVKFVNGVLFVEADEAEPEIITTEPIDIDEFVGDLDFPEFEELDDEDA